MSWKSGKVAGIPQGPDAAEFLNRIYTNAWLNLAPGKCRYGLMLGEDGMIMDDGVTSSLGENHYLMTTTSGGAPRVMAWLEEWLQTEWPDLKVYLTSVTEQFATLQLAGPNARDLLSEFTTDVDLDSSRDQTHAICYQSSPQMLTWITTRFLS